MLMTLVVAISGTAPTETMAKSVNENTVIAITPKNAVSSTRFSKKQIDVLTKAYNIAESDGHSNPKLLQGIALKESKAGAYLSSKAKQQHKPQFGVAQVKVVAARAVFEYWPALWKTFGFKTKSDSEIKQRLINDDYFNLSIASKYLKMLRAKYNISSDKTLLAIYNQGPSGLKHRARQAVRYAAHVIKLAAGINV